jgi:diguanylate cyclase (GGDEF)-like protein/PAS domain S-box-containing protein
MRLGDDVTQGPVILIVDDDASGRFLTRAALEPHGFAVVEAEDGAQGVAAFENRRPDFVILDLLMPGMDGLEVCAAIRRLPGGENVPILVLTGLEDPTSVQRAYDSGATDFVTKPLDWAILGHRVRYMLRAKQAFDDLKKSEARLAQAQRIAGLGYWRRDLRSGALHCSAEVCGLFGRPGETGVLGREAFLELIRPEDKEAVIRALDAAVRGEEPYSVDFRVDLGDGTTRYLHDIAEVVRDETGTPVRMEGTTQDVTWRKEAEERIRFLAYYDGLTKLPNRVFFLENLRLALANSQRHGRTLALLFLDLDDFKRINDTMGHLIGDRLLQGVAARLRGILRRSDPIARTTALPGTDLVGRIGGDEFIVAAAEIAREEHAAIIARRVLDSLAEPFRLEEHEVRISASIGISLFPNDGSDGDALLRNADLAMYHAKESGGNCYQFFDEAMNTAAQKRMRIETDLRKAIDRRELVLHYQPQVDVASGAIVGTEALIRWRHPERGLVSPAEFIPLAEETCLILTIGEWVLQEACAQAKAWQDAGYPPLPVTANISGRHFWLGKIIEVVDKAITAAGLDPRYLELEITERILIRAAVEAIDTFKALKGMGLRISLDDFGSGFSSLSYLARFPIDAIKIDRSFVQDLGIDPEAATITTTAIGLARNLGIEVIAEGVETQEQAEFLRERGCRLMQGDLFAKPSPPDEIERRLRIQGGRGGPAAAA